MTLKQYISQPDPIRGNTVQLNRWNYSIGSTTKQPNGETETSIFIHFPKGSYDTMRNEYKQKNKDNYLYTTDQHGNRKSLSVFRLPEPKQKQLN